MKEIKHPRRLLVIGSPKCDVAGFLRGLTGTSPVADANGSIAGSIHEWTLTTKYYSTELPIWIDEVTNASEWKSEFSKPEAKEVIEAIGGWICVFDPSADSDEINALIEAVDSVINQACGYEWDGAKIVAAYSATASDGKVYENEVLDDFATDHGFELVDANASGANAFGEQQGFARIIESLGANDWTAAPVSTTDDNDIDEEQEMTEEFWDMKASLLQNDGGPDDDDELQDFESLLISARAVKEMGEDLPPEQRKRLQQRAAQDLVARAMRSKQL